MNSVLQRPAATIAEHDLAKRAWRGLSNFLNENYVAASIIKARKLDQRQKSNARKQAAQIRYALMQAREYFASWSEVSQAVRPVLAYYCTMSLALAQILWKGDGDVSLDRARAEHRHHGLSFTFGGAREPTLSKVGSELRALPFIGTDGRRGTFDLWHRSARHSPLFGTHVRHLVGGGSQTGLRAIFYTTDERMPLLPSEGISLLELLSMISGMSDMLRAFDLVPSMVRCRTKLDQYDGENVRLRYDFTVQPGDSVRIEEFLRHLEFEAAAVNSLQVTEFPIGVGLSWEEDRDRQFRIKFPEGYNANSKDIYLSETMTSLNEFGIYYVGLYIAGMLARYYPDAWIRHIEDSTELFLAVDRLLDVARERVPILTLTELTNTAYLPEA